MFSSSAIASLVGAPRVLQAVAKDKLFPLLEGFSKGHGANNDPFRGYILVFFLSLVCVLIGDLDKVSRYVVLEFLFYQAINYVYYCLGKKLITGYFLFLQQCSG